MCGSPGTTTSSRKRRSRLRFRLASSHRRKLAGYLLAGLVFTMTMTPSTTLAQGPVRISLDEAIQLALRHNHTLLAARTTILQSQAEEMTANLRPNPTLFADWEYLPLGAPSHQNPDVYSG